MRARQRSSLHPPGFTLVELLVTISIIALLVGLLLPAVQAAREAARRMQCQNNLHQIALATLLFHDSQRAMPPARYQPRPGAPVEQACGGSETTWLVRILPYLEQSALERQWNYAVPYADHGAGTRTSALAVYCCPSRRTVSEATGEGVVASTATSWIVAPCGCRFPVLTSDSMTVSGALGDYGGNHGDLSPGASGLPTDFYYGGNGTGVVISSRARCEGELPRDWIDRVTLASITDGCSNTLLAGEMHVPRGKLRQSPEDSFIYNGDNLFGFARVGGPTVPITSDLSAVGNALTAWGSWHVGVCQFAMADGSVRTLSTSTDTDSLARLGNRADGLPVQIAE